MIGHKYLYINQFDWKDASVDFQEEPKTNSIYKAEENKKFYRVILSVVNGAARGFDLEKKLMKGEFDTWDCDVEEVTLDNLFDLAISNKDLKMMAEDGDSIKEGIAEEQAEDSLAEMTLLNGLGESLYELKEFDLDHYEALTSMTTKISDAISSPTYIQLTEGLSFDPRAARIANISIATNLLESHINNKNELDLSDILDAIYYLTLEVIRIHKTNKLIKSIK